jgi:hypothetical protein
MVYDHNFYSDLKIGNHYEIIVLNKLLQKKNKTHSINNKIKSNFDFIYGNSKYEVKYDKRSLISNNFFIECVCNNKNSGIYTTEAKYYVITNGTDYYKIKVKYLLKEMIKYKYIKFKIYNSMEGYIINVNDFKKIKSCYLL